MAARKRNVTVLQKSVQGTVACEKTVLFLRFFCWFISRLEQCAACDMHASQIIMQEARQKHLRRWHQPLCNDHTWARPYLCSCTLLQSRSLRVA